jgi:hypothetical protein
MRVLLAAVTAAALLASPALAQPPQEVSPDGLISIDLGQAKAFEFSEPFGEIYFAPKGVVEGVPQSDRQFSISPLTSGTARMFVRDANGQLMYNVDIVVAPEPGRIVKLYGGSKNDDLNAGYVAVYCTATGCERPDKDLPRPTAITVERVSRFRDGAEGPR